ncbi:MAG: hypothetical protein ACK5ZV_05100 [bacterium]
MFQPLLPNHVLMQPPVLLLVLAVLLLLWPLAVLLLVRAWRGTPVGLTPTCRRCGFDLTGMLTVPPTTATEAQCPECGNRLTHGGAVGLGRLKRSPLLLTAAMGAVLAAGAPAVGLVAVLVSGVNWENYRTAGGLLQSVRSGRSDVATHEAVARRIAAGRLDENDLARALLERLRAGHAWQTDNQLGSSLVPRLGNATLEPEVVRDLYQLMVMGKAATDADGRVSGPGAADAGGGADMGSVGWTVDLAAESAFFWRLNLIHTAAGLLPGLPPADVTARIIAVTFVPDGGGPPRPLAIRGSPGGDLPQSTVTLLGSGALSFRFVVSPESEFTGPGRLTVRADITLADPIGGGEYGPWPVEVTVGWSPPK